MINFKVDGTTSQVIPSRISFYGLAGNSQHTPSERLRITSDGKGWDWRFQPK